MLRKSLISIFTLASGIALLVACGEGSKGAQNPSYVAAQSCTAGTVYISSYNNVTYNSCFPTAQCTQAGYGSNYGYISQINQCVAGVIGGSGTIGGFGHAYAGSIQVTDSGVYQQVLKDWSVCDTAPFWNVANLNCNNWDDQAAIAFKVNGNTLPAMGQIAISAYYVNYGQWLATSILDYTSQVAASDNNTTFTFQSLGTGFGYNKTFKAVADHGNIVDANNNLITPMRMRLYYNNVQFGVADIYLQY